MKWRKNGIGGSDVSALLGISKWKSALELWLDKTGQEKISADNVYQLLLAFDKLYNTFTEVE